MAIRTLQAVFYIYLFIATFSLPLSMAGSNSLTPNGTECVCPGDEIIYTCNVLGGATTVWSGTTLDCGPGAITLRHMPSLFQPGTFDYCNGNITSEIVGIEGNCYISRLTVAAIDTFNNTSVDCSRQDPERLSIESSTIFIVPASDYLPEPNGFKVSSVNMTEITISWTEVNSLCSKSISYNVASNCSDVTCTTTRKEGICSNLPIATVCSFSIHSEVCGQQQNNAITLTLRRPQANITPVYSPGSSSTITKVIVTIYPEPFLSVAGDGPSPVISYSFSYSIGSISIPVCQEREVMCRRSVDFTCPPWAEIEVMLFASNTLGRGPATDPTTLGCTNDFVSVRYDSATSTITCNFLDETDTSIKSCSLQQCDQMLASGPGQNSTVEAPNSIALRVATGDSDCYLVTASSNSFTITVEVITSVDTGTGNANTRAVIGISIGVVVGVIVIAVASVVVIIFAIIKMKSKRKPASEGVPLTTAYYDDQAPWKEYKPYVEFRMFEEIKAEEIIEQFQLQEISADDIRVFDIKKDIELEELKKLTKEVESKFKIGKSFHLFEGELEDIPKQRKIIFLHETGSKHYTSNITSLKKNRHLFDRMTNLRKLFQGYRVFVERFEADEKTLKAGTAILYEIQKTNNNTEDVVTEDATTKGNSESNTDGTPKNYTEDDTKVNPGGGTDSTSYSV